jgi:aminoglycoside 3-N-acetyltransferase
VAAIGAKAATVAWPHHDDDAYGPGTPYARLVELAGQVAVLGEPLDTVSLVHHAEAIARVPGKRRVRGAIP